jgi:hypothetical protein
MARDNVRFGDKIIELYPEHHAGFALAPDPLDHVPTGSGGGRSARMRDEPKGRGERRGDALVVAQQLPDETLTQGMERPGGGANCQPLTDHAKCLKHLIVVQRYSLVSHLLANFHHS